MPAHPRSTVLGVSAAVATALLAGCGGVQAPTGATAAAATPTATRTATPTATRTVTPTATPTAAPTATRRPGSTPAAPRRAPSRPSRPAAPLPFVRDPAAAGLDFGFVTAAGRKGNRIVVTFDRATMLTGEQAEDYLERHPEIDAYDVVIVNRSRRVRTFRLLPSATLYGSQLLGPANGTDTEQISAAQLVRRVASRARGVPVWLKHKGGPDGPVVYLAEQYLP